jgi:hypothetical protein
MATDAQTEANRKNAQKSTGPRTEAGKSRASRNATRHNLCGHVPFTSDEERTEGDSEQFKLLLADLREEHLPDGPTEDIFVFKMAEHFWMGQRASWLLAKHLSVNEDSSLDDEGNFKDNVKQVSLMLRYHTTADRGFIKNFNELRKLQKERRLEEIGSVPQNAGTKQETAQAEPKPPEKPAPSTDLLPPIVVDLPDSAKIVVSYLPTDIEKNRPTVQRWLASKGLLPKQAA